MAPGSLAPLHVDDREMLRYANTGHFPLIAAAVASDVPALHFVASAQTFGFFALLLFVVVYYARRGFVSEQLRGWSNAVWITGLVVICLLPSLFPDLTLQHVDYGITGSWSDTSTPLDAVYGESGVNRHMLPAVFLFERGLFGAIVLAAFAYVVHDLGYRAREALEEFGLIENESPYVEAKTHAGAGRSSSAGAQAQFEGASQSAFGQRRAPPPRSEPISAAATARMVLGVSATASRREIERAYRAQMKRAHPDHGGTVERAAALNAARDALLRKG